MDELSACLAEEGESVFKALGRRFPALKGSTALFCRWVEEEQQVPPTQDAERFSWLFALGCRWADERVIRTAVLEGVLADWGPGGGNHARAETFASGLGLSLDEFLSEAWAVLYRVPTHRLPTDSGNPAGWLYRVVANRLGDQRKHDRWLADRRESLRPVEEIAAESSDLLPQERLARLPGCIERLCEAERLVIQAKLEGRPQKDVADELGVVAKTVQRITVAALAKLRTCLGD